MWTGRKQMRRQWHKILGTSMEGSLEKFVQIKNALTLRRSYIEEIRHCTSVYLSAVLLAQTQIQMQVFPNCGGEAEAFSIPLPNI